MKELRAARPLREHLYSLAAVIAIPVVFVWFRSSQSPDMNIHQRAALRPSISARPYGEHGAAGREARRKSVLALADPATGSKVMSAEHQAAVTRIDAELDRAARRLMEAELAQWERRGGFHTGPLPGFSNPLSERAQELQALRRTAEQKILATMSSEERRKWQTLGARETPSELKVTPAATRSAL